MVMEGIMITKKEYNELVESNKRRLEAIDYINDLLGIIDTSDVQFSGDNHLESIKKMLGENK
jgi:hypothetical protein